MLAAKWVAGKNSSTPHLIRYRPPVIDFEKDTMIKIMRCLSAQLPIHAVFVAEQRFSAKGLI
jgi:hypothetical protein